MTMILLFIGGSYLLFGGLHWIFPSSFGIPQMGILSVVAWPYFQYLRREWGLP